MMVMRKCCISGISVLFYFIFAFSDFKYNSDGEKEVAVKKILLLRLYVPR